MEVINTKIVQDNDFVHPKDSSLRFPFVRDILAPPEKLVRDLYIEFESGSQDYDPRANALSRFYDKYWKLDSISNHFTEHVRVKCRISGKPTMVEVWRSLEPDVIRSFRTVEEARSKLLYEYGAGQCNPFSPALALRMYLGYNRTRDPVRVIDPSAGWGDRMIAAIAAGDFVAEYHGYDPNEDLREPYAALMNQLDHTKKCRFFCEPFEKADVKRNYYDLGVTSPPYFDLEDYSEAKTQSISGDRKNYPRWLKEFYEPYLNNLVAAIKPGGKIIIYVSDFTTPDRQLIDLARRTQVILGKECKLLKKGELRTSAGNGRRPYNSRPFFIFGKL